MEEYLDGRQLCRFLGCSRSTVYRLRRAGLPSQRLSQGRVLFAMSEILEWLHQHRPRRFRVVLYRQEAERRAERRALAAARTTLV